MVRILLALKARTTWQVYHFDVRSTFLNGEIMEEVFIEQPKGYIVKGNENMVYKLRKTLYG